MWSTEQYFTLNQRLSSSQLVSSQQHMQAQSISAFSTSSTKRFVASKVLRLCGGGNACGSSKHNENQVKQPTSANNQPQTNNEHQQRGDQGKDANQQAQQELNVQPENNGSKGANQKEQVQENLQSQNIRGNDKNKEPQQQKELILVQQIIPNQEPNKQEQPNVQSANIDSQEANAIGEAKLDDEFYIEQENGRQSDEEIKLGEEKLASLLEASIQYLTCANNFFVKVSRQLEIPEAEQKDLEDLWTKLHQIFPEDKDFFILSNQNLRITNEFKVSVNGLEDKSPIGYALIGYILTQLIGLVDSESLEDVQLYQQNLQDWQDQIVYQKNDFPIIIKDQRKFLKKLIKNLQRLDIRVVKLFLLFNRKNLKSEENLENSVFLNDEYLNDDKQTLRDEKRVRELLQQELLKLLPTSLIALSTTYCKNNNCSGETFINGTIGLKETLFKNLQQPNTNEKDNPAFQATKDDQKLQIQLQQMECFEVLLHEFIHKKRQATSSGGYTLNSTPVKFKQIDNDSAGESGLWFVQKLLGIKYQFIKYSEILQIKDDDIKVSESTTTKVKDIINDITLRFLDIESWKTRADISKARPLLEIGQKLEMLKEYIDKKEQQSNKKSADEKNNKKNKISKFHLQKSSQEDEDENDTQIKIQANDDLSPQEKSPEPYYSSQSTYIKRGLALRNFDERWIKNLAELKKEN